MTKEELLKAKQNLEILKLSGYPSIDKPWVVNYNQKELGKEIPKRTAFEVVAREVSFCGSKSETGTVSRPAAPEQPPVYQNANQSDFEEITDDEDLPF